MKKSDQYHKWVEWSDEDEAYIGKCPDLITGMIRRKCTPICAK
jgi:hypothetical protein